MTDNDGGPAFPSPNDVRIGDVRAGGHGGMSLRDWFAAQALAGVMHDRNIWDSTVDEERAIAGRMHRWADAMLREREQREPE